MRWNHYSLAPTFHDQELCIDAAGWIGLDPGHGLQTDAVAAARNLS